MNRILDFLASEEGPTTVEYAIMLAFIVLICVTAISQIGQATNQPFKDVGDMLAP